MVYVPAPLAVVVKAMKLLSWMFKCLEQSHMCCKKACLTPSLQELVLSLSLEVKFGISIPAKLPFSLNNFNVMAAGFFTPTCGRSKAGKVGV